MTNETLSALVDGETSDRECDELVAEAARDPAVRAAWQRYQVIGASLRGELDGGVSLSADFADRVSARLEAEPAPRRASTGTVVPAALKGLRTVVPLAVAAGLGALAVLVFQPIDDPVGLPDSGLVASRDAGGAIDSGVRWQSETPKDEETLNTFLVEHGEFTLPSGMNGLIAYAKFVSYDTGR